MDRILDACVFGGVPSLVGIACVLFARFVAFPTTIRASTKFVELRSIEPVHSDLWFLVLLPLACTAIDFILHPHHGIERSFQSIGTKICFWISLVVVAGFSCAMRIDRDGVVVSWLLFRMPFMKTRYSTSSVHAAFEFDVDGDVPPRVVFEVLPERLRFAARACNSSERLAAGFNNAIRQLAE